MKTDENTESSPPTYIKLPASLITLIVVTLCLVGVAAVVVIVRTPVLSESEVSGVDLPPPPPPLPPPPLPPPLPPSPHAISKGDVDRTARQMKSVSDFILAPLELRLLGWITRNPTDRLVASDQSLFFALGKLRKDYQLRGAVSNDREVLVHFLTEGDPERRPMYTMYLKGFRAREVGPEFSGEISLGTTSFRIGRELPPLNESMIQYIDRGSFDGLSRNVQVFVRHKALQEWQRSQKVKGCTTINMPIRRNLPLHSFNNINLTPEEQSGNTRELLLCRLRRGDYTLTVTGGHDDVYQLIINCFNNPQASISGYYLWPGKENYIDDNSPVEWKVKFLACVNPGNSGFMLLNTFQVDHFMDPPV